MVHRFKPAVEILVPLWKAGLEASQPSEVRSAWIEVWGVDEVSGRLPKEFSLGCIQTNAAFDWVNKIIL